MRRVRIWGTRGDGKIIQINKVVKEFCNFSRRIKTVSIMSKNCKYPKNEGKTLLHRKHFHGMSH